MTAAEKTYFIQIIKNNLNNELPSVKKTISNFNKLENNIITFQNKNQVLKEFLKFKLKYSNN
ncbi:hypothetical protein PIROE2DRAFT_3916 [Piromyces sp. E2]|nr:hypothetical protein PIROE2DRAFT_3916 [Piromyces sp. E2]|eukprot:OUM68456.1 hypothetical protein PIROE2DRAFT_3916 [Piromyces sp. E2]